MSKDDEEEYELVPMFAPDPNPNGLVRIYERVHKKLEAMRKQTALFLMLQVEISKGRYQRSLPHHIVEDHAIYADPRIAEMARRNAVSLSGFLSDTAIRMRLEPRHLFYASEQIKGLTLKQLEAMFDRVVEENYKLAMEGLNPRG